MSTIRVRRLDENWEPCFGNGQNDFLTDKEAVAQIIKQRLLLWLGEWWEDASEGLPMVEKILGRRIKDKGMIDTILKKRVKDTQYVTGISKFTSSFSPTTRNYECSIYVDTQFGTVLITNGGTN